MAVAIRSCLIATQLNGTTKVLDNARPTGGGLIGSVLVTERLQRRIRTDFPAPGSAQEIVRLVGGAHEGERVQTAIVLLADGNVSRLFDSIKLVSDDWRDALVAADLAGADWQIRLDQLLGP